MNDYFHIIDISDNEEEQSVNNLTYMDYFILSMNKFINYFWTPEHNCFHCKVGKCVLKGFS